ncbi:hypothetical protein LOTGIDRAFT_160978 [Lottia gigantea]|uniref:DNA-directed DNA polymerase n=1 Tax=Lottia gigantea TaxID=225164 RepID=V4BZZ9_LOTGI|nr:hypothetical protein LOTGIDRAFT_160978 [Lottia gigantea]ESO94744.1 hypothetical protein LOTGIDRAFT_160978 [Lottia gigantea]
MENLRDDDALTCFAQFKLNVISQPHDDTLFAWDCETYSENKAIPYCCTLVNLEKLRKKLELIKRVFPDLKPTDPIPEEYYNKLMTNIVEIFVGTDCFDQMLRRLGTVDQKRLTLIAHNASGFDNWIALQSISKLTQCPLVTDKKILSLPLSNPYTEERLQKKWKRKKKEIKISDKNNYLQNICLTCSYQHESSSLAKWGNSSKNLRKIEDVDIAKYTFDNWESLRH